MPHPTPDPTGPGQESVWSYPRPPALDTVARRVRVECEGRLLADTTSAIRVLETSHPPTYYLDSRDVRLDLLRPTAGTTFCEWKGEASYFDVVVGTTVIERAAWWYREPHSDFGELAYHVAFYPALVECYVDDERVVPQPGGFYGGWVTGDVVGPFKGIPGSHGW